MAAPLSMAQLNSEMKGLLASLQNSRTQASLTFKDVRTSSKRALGLAMSALYKKVGAKNEFSVRLTNLSYQYGSRPTTKGEGTVQLDFTKLMAQEDLNQLIPSIQTMVDGITNSYAAQYGQAGNLVAKVSDLKKDAQGNYVSLKANVTFRLDYAKLPANLRREDVMFDSGRFNFSLDVKQGITFNFDLASNGAYKGFEASEKGLKEYIEALLAKDASTMDEIKTLFRQLDEGAEGIVEGKLR